MLNKLPRVVCILPGTLSEAELRDFLWFCQVDNERYRVTRAEEILQKSLNSLARFSKCMVFVTLAGSSQCYGRRLVGSSNDNRLFCSPNNVAHTVYLMKLLALKVM
jgi:hypothetical protein